MNEDYTVRAFDAKDLDTGTTGGQYSTVNALKQTDAGLKTLLSWGGYTFGTRLFESMSASAANRKTFIDSAISFARVHGFDGIDIDWEYPNWSSKQNYATLIQELAESISVEAAESQNEKLLLTAAVSPWETRINNGYDVPKLSKFFDFIMLMSYDFHGPWESQVDFHTPLYPRADDSVALKKLTVDGAARLWNENGMPKEKIIIGIGTYGKGWTLQDPSNHAVKAPATGGSKPKTYTQESGNAAYFEICEMLADGAAKYWSDEQKVPYLVYKNEWFGYDDEQSVKHKMMWLKANGYGGAFIWTLDFDDFNGQCSNGNGKRYPLLSVIKEELVYDGQSTLETISTTLPSVSATGTDATTTLLPETDATEQPGYVCEDKVDGFHPDSNNCSQFILCINKQAYSLNCPETLHFFIHSWILHNTGICWLCCAHHHTSS